MATRKGVDDVLQAAVDAGDVPCVVAMAGDRDGVIYEGAAGERTPGSGEMVGPDTMFRIASMTKMVATVAALQLVEQGELDLDDPVETYLPEYGELQVLEGFDGDMPRLRAPASKATVRHLVTHTSRARPTGSGTPTCCAGTRSPGRRTCCRARWTIFRAPLVADPGARLRVRHQHRLARPRRRGRRRAVAARPPRRAHPRPARDDLDDLPDGPARSARTASRSTCAARTARGRRAISTGRRSPSGGPAVTACTRRRTTTCASSACCSTAARSTAPRSSSARPSRRRSRTRSASSTSRARSSTADPDSSADFAAGPGYKWGLGLLLNTERRAGHARGRQRRLGGHLQHPLLGRPRDRRDRRRSTRQSLPFAEPRVFALYPAFEQALYASLAEAAGAAALHPRGSARGADLVAAHGPGRRPT